MNKDNYCLNFFIFIALYVLFLYLIPIERVIFILILGILTGAGLIGVRIIGDKIHDYLIRKGFNLSFKYDYIILNNKKVPFLKEAKGLVRKLNPYSTSIEIIGRAKVGIEDDTLVFSKLNDVPLIRFKKKQDHRIIPLKIDENKYGIYLREEA
jgi:hypothetical protein